MSPLISVVITTKNEEKNIENCLRSVVRQTYPSDKIEIIVVDNNSIDKTKEKAEKYTKNVFNKGPERSEQRNFGAKQAKGKYYLYLDADMILSKDVIKEAIEKFKKDKNLTALYIPEIIMGNSFWCKVRRFERSFCNATILDAVRIIRLKDFLETGGFDTNMIAAEDWDLTKRLRKYGTFNIIKSFLYHNEKNLEIPSYLRKKIFYSKDIKNYINKWGETNEDLKKQLGAYYRVLGVFIENGKWKRLLRHPVLSLGVFTLRFLVGVGYLSVKFNKFNN